MTDNNLNNTAVSQIPSKTAITSPELAPPVGPFSQAVKIDGSPQNATLLFDG